jgi:hypothetical protein
MGNAEDRSGSCEPPFDRRRATSASAAYDRLALCPRRPRDIGLRRDEFGDAAANAVRATQGSEAYTWGDCVRRHRETH